MPLQVTVTRTPPVPGSCDAPLTLTFVADGGVREATTSGDTTGGPVDLGASCATSSYRTYALHLTSPQTLNATVSTTSATYLPALALRVSDCFGSAATCGLAANPGSGVTLDAGTLAAGDYFLWVGGGPFATIDAGPMLPPTSGPFTLDVTLSP